MDNKQGGRAQPQAASDDERLSRLLVELRRALVTASRALDHYLKEMNRD